MEANRPYQDSEMDAEGIPDLEPPVNQDEGQIPPRDYPQGVDQFGTTPSEQRQDEPLAERVLREEPEPGAGDVPATADPTTAGAGGADPLEGRLVAPGSEDVDGVDDEKDEVALLVGEDEGAQSAEEAAMQVRDSP